jgi:hypothetical protein
MARKAALVYILMGSLDPERNEQYVQYNTARKMRAVHADFWQASIEGQNDAVVQSNTNLFSTNRPTYEPSLRDSCTECTRDKAISCILMKQSRLK